MTKADIISKTLREMGPIQLENGPPYIDEPDEQELVLSVLQWGLPTDVDIRTCEDFKHLGVECCQTCHGFYPHYDMSLIDLPDGEKAWVCDTVKRAICVGATSKTPRL